MENNNLAEFVDSIRHISLNHNDLMDVAIDFTNTYFSHKAQEHEDFDKFWQNENFMDQTLMSAREGIVMAMSALTLEKETDFSHLVKECVDIEAQDYNVNKATQVDNEIKILKDFFVSLRRETFSRVYHENKQLHKITKLSKNLLKDRYEYFMKYQSKD